MKRSELLERSADDSLKEHPDATSVEFEIGRAPELDLKEMLRNMVHEVFNQASLNRSEDVDSPEEADDFSPDDDPSLFSPYEMELEQELERSEGPVPGEQDLAPEAEDEPAEGTGSEPAPNQGGEPSEPSEGAEGG